MCHDAAERWESRVDGTVECAEGRDAGVQVTKVPKEVQRERALEAKESNAVRRKQAQDKNAGKTRMKGKNRATARHRKRQDNIIEVCPSALHLGAQAGGMCARDVTRPSARLASFLLRVPLHRNVQERKGDVKERMREQKVLQDAQRERRAEANAALEKKLESVPRALHRLHKHGTL